MRALTMRLMARFSVLLSAAAWKGRPNLMRGSVYERWHKCGRRGCGCAGDGPKHLTRQLTVTLGGRTQTRYVRVGEVEPVQALIAAYEELWAIVNGLTAVNLALLRGAHPGGRRRRGARR